MIILQYKNETIRPSYSVKFQPNKKQNIRVFLEHSVLPIISSVFGSVFPNMFLVLSITNNLTDLGCRRRKGGNGNSGRDGMAGLVHRDGVLSIHQTNCNVEVVAIGLDDMF